MIRIFKKLSTAVLVLFLVVVVVLGISAATDMPPFKQIRSTTQDALQSYLDSARDRYAVGQSTALDTAAIWTMASVGTATIGWLAPEAQSIMIHYVFGDGEDIVSDSEYFARSDYLKHLGAEMRSGETRRSVWVLPTSRDYRLAMAVNGFDLQKARNSDGLYVYTLTRRIDYPDKKWAVFDFYIGKYHIRFYDMLVHLMNPTPFDYQASWVAKT